MADKGDIAYTGSLTPLSNTRRGGTVTAFSSNPTRLTVEDSGSATLVRGIAAVQLDPTFASAIDAGTYRVFRTPGGDTRGLFVAAKTAHGFIVRESQGGRSTVAFDYRILATAIGKGGQSMAIAPDNALSPAYTAQNALRFRRFQLRRRHPVRSKAPTDRFIRRFAAISVTHAPVPVLVPRAPARIPAASVEPATP